MNDEQCEYIEEDPQGGVARCKRAPHKGVHIVVRKDGGSYMDTPNLAIMAYCVQPGEFKMVYGDDLSYRPSPRL